MSLSPYEKKLPEWAAVPGLLAPPSLSLEQCSGPAAARHKAALVREYLPEGGDLLADLTGGLGVDFTTLAPLFRRAVYAERNEELCRLAQHNFPLLGVRHAEVLHTEAAEALRGISGADLLYMDPARRDAAGRRTLLVEDCTPDATLLLPEMLARSRFVLLKLAPMLDIKRALTSLARPAERVDIVAVGGECKELLFLFRSDAPVEAAGAAEPLITCIDDTYTFAFRPAEEAGATAACTATVGDYLYEPGAAVLKAGAFKLVAARFGLQKLHPNSHLYTADHAVDGFPGRRFRVRTVSSFAKRDVRRLLAETDRANLAVRNFPGTVAELRKRFKLRDGGTQYWFATTLADRSHVLIATEKC